MTSSLQRIALVGAGGNLGRYVVPELRKYPAFQLTIITRESSKSEFQGEEKVVKVTDDYSEESLTNAFAGQDAVVVMTNAMSGAAQYRMIDVAIKVGVKRYIPSDFGGSGDVKAVEIFPKFANNFKVLDYLRSQESSGLTWTNILTGIWVDMGIPNGFMGYRIAERSATIWDSGDTRFCLSTRPHIAKAVAAVLNKPDLTKNREFYTASFTTCQNEILRCFEKATGTTWKVEHVTSEDQIRIGKEGLQKGEFKTLINLPLAVSYSGRGGADFEAAGKLNNDLLGLEDDDLQEVITDLAKTS